MISLLDHISSIMVYGALAFVIASTQLSAQRTAAQQTIVYASKKQTLDFADTIERDFKLIGSGITDRSQMIASLQTDAAGNATSFSFRYNNEAGVAQLVEYRLVATKIVLSQGAKVQLYRVERYVGGVESGGGPSTLRRFRVQFLTAGGSVTTDKGVAELIRITLTNTLPMGRMDDFFLPETNWAITLRPLNLAL